MKTILSDQVNYSDIITVEKNNQGDIVLLSADWIKINEINKQISLCAERSLKEKIKNGIPVPLLAYTGINLISGYGKEIYFKAISVSGVVCEFYSKLEGEGINQTLHSLYLNVNSVIIVNFALNRREIKESVPVLLCETVLIGKVPEIYLSGNIL